MAGRVSGDALVLISPRLRAANRHAYKTVDELYGHLEELYGDPNKERNARQCYGMAHATQSHRSRARWRPAGPTPNTQCSELGAQTASTMNALRVGRTHDPLAAQYQRPNTQQQEHGPQAFKDLTMKKEQTFQEFYALFLHHVANGNISPHDLKDELNDKLLWKLQKIIRTRLEKRDCTARKPEEAHKAAGGAHSAQLPKTQVQEDQADPSSQTRGGFGPHAARPEGKKRAALREVSSSRLKGIEVAEVDLSQLLGGMAFTLSCVVSNNGLGIKTSSLIDTRANGHTFIDTKFAKTVERFLGVPPSPLKVPCK
ncbi:hypothetical protein GP486_008469, partial [Trichoglossum hirsutum]